MQRDKVVQSYSASQHRGQTSDLQMDSGTRSPLCGTRSCLHSAHPMHAREAAQPQKPLLACLQHMPFITHTHNKFNKEREQQVRLTAFNTVLFSCVGGGGVCVRVCTCGHLRHIEYMKVRGHHTSQSLFSPTTMAWDNSVIKLGSSGSVASVPTYRAFLPEFLV